MVEFTITTRCALIIIGGVVVSLRDVNVAHSFLAPESHYMRRPSSRRISCDGRSIIQSTRSILLSSSKSSSTRPETTINSVLRKDNGQNNPKCSTTTTEVSSAKSKKYNFSQLVDDVWANVGGGGTSSSLSSSSIDSDVHGIKDTSASSESTETTKWILIGGTVLVLAAAWGLAVTMGNELGIDLEFG